MIQQIAIHLTAACALAYLLWEALRNRKTPSPVVSSRKQEGAPCSRCVAAQLAHARLFPGGNSFTKIERGRLPKNR
jgi:hypothetical protein